MCSSALQCIVVQYSTEECAVHRAKLVQLDAGFNNAKFYCTELRVEIRSGGWGVKSWQSISWESEEKTQD